MINDKSDQKEKNSTAGQSVFNLIRKFLWSLPFCSLMNNFAFLGPEQQFK